MRSMASWLQPDALRPLVVPPAFHQQCCRVYLPIMRFTTATTSLEVGSAAASKFGAYGMGTCTTHIAEQLHDYATAHVVAHGHCSCHH